MKRTKFSCPSIQARFDSVLKATLQCLDASNSLNSTPEIQLPAGEVHIWIEQLSFDPGLIVDGKAILSEDEIARAGRFHHQRDHDGYVSAHARLRRILSKYTGVDASNLRFEVSEFGKPSLPKSMNDHRLNFNLSHSGVWFMVGIVRDARIGVDIEEIKPESATMDVAERFFTKRETAELQTVVADQRVIAFFNCWTRKEAYLKALGCGFSSSPIDCEVTILPTAAPEIRQPLPQDRARWSLLHFSAAAYVGAAAIDQRSIRLKRQTAYLD